MGKANSVNTQAAALLLQLVPAGVLWRHVQGPQYARIKHPVLQGFQDKPATLKLPAVRARLLHHLSANPEEAAELAALWAGSDPPPPAVAAVRQSPPDAEALPVLLQQYGGALVLALLAEGQEELFSQAQQALAEVPDKPKPKKAETAVSARKATQASLLATISQIKAQVTEQDKLRHKTETDLKRQAQAAARAHQQALKQLTTRHQMEIQTLKQQLAVALRDLQEARENAGAQARELDRERRKTHRIEKERDESRQEAKRLRTQNQQQQNLAEERRREIAQLQHQLSTAVPAALASSGTPTTTEVQAPPAVPSVPPPPSVPPLVASTQQASTITEADRPLQWEMDGRKWSTTARMMCRLVDEGNEVGVYQLQQSLHEVRELDADFYRKVMRRLRDLGRYYETVFSGRSRAVLVDASNVARYQPNARKKGKLCDLLEMRRELRRQGYFPITMIADASLPHFIDNKAELKAMVTRGEILMVDAGHEADDEITRLVQRTSAPVVTNDRSFHAKVAPHLIPRRIGFSIADGIVTLQPESN